MTPPVSADQQTERVVQVVAAEMARHRDVIDLVDEVAGDPFSGNFRYGCTCGHERGVWTERESLLRMAQTMDEQRQHIAEHVARAAIAAVGPGQAEEANDTYGLLRDTLRIHHPIMRSETGPLSGCRCGGVKLGQDVIHHVVFRLRAALDGDATTGGTA